MKTYVTALTASILLFLAAVGLARPVKTWSHQELFQTADVVVLLDVIRIDVAREDPARHGIAETYQAYVAQCRVLGVMKGDLKRKEVLILFFQHPDGRPGFNGVIPAPFSRDTRLEYLAYLRVNHEGGLIPVTGNENAGQSIKAVMKSLDDRYLDLPPANRKAASK